MSTQRIHLFISHSWAYSGHYDTLRSWIFERSWSVGRSSLAFSDLSVPKDNPVHSAGSDRLLQAAIYRRIDRSHVVICPTGMYANYSKWIRKELAGAKAKRKLILGVDPWGQQRRSSVVGGAARETVGWNGKSVVEGIWRCFLETGY